MAKDGSLIFKGTLRTLCHVFCKWHLNDLVERLQENAKRCQKCKMLYPSARGRGKKCTKKVSQAWLAVVDLDLCSLHSYILFSHFNTVTALSLSDLIKGRRQASRGCETCNCSWTVERNKLHTITWGSPCPLLSESSLIAFLNCIYIDISQRNTAHFIRIAAVFTAYFSVLYATPFSGENGLLLFC